MSDIPQLGYMDGQFSQAYNVSLMEDYDKKFAIMLSKHLVEILDNWPVSEACETLAEIRKIKTVSNPPMYLLKDKYEVSYIEPKLVRNPKTEKIEYGTVFQLNCK